MPAVQEQMAGGDTLENVFERADSISKRFALDTETIRAFEVESLPLIIGSENNGRHALALSFVHGGEYAGNDPYRCTQASVFCSLVDAGNVPNILEDGSAWDMESLSLGNGAVQSIREPVGGFTQEPELVVRRDEDREGNFNRSDTNALIGKILDVDIPGSHRLKKSISRVAESSTIYYSVVISRSQSYDDFKMVRGFIKSLGIGRVSVSNFVPVYDKANDNVRAVEIDQERYFDPARPSPVIDWGRQISSDVKVTPEVGYSYRQESQGDEKNMQISNKQKTEYVLGCLENSAESKVPRAADLYNIPLTRKNLAGLLDHHVAIL